MREQDYPPWVYGVDCALSGLYQLTIYPFKMQLLGLLKVCPLLFCDYFVPLRLATTAFQTCILTHSEEEQERGHGEKGFDKLSRGWIEIRSVSKLQ